MGEFETLIEAARRPVRESSKAAKIWDKMGASYFGKRLLLTRSDNVPSSRFSMGVDDRRF
ncbi:MAG: hypothetical protein DMG60_05670 [Acidobacteria bacterium]|nr:MAG: hypothetical protein DMG60_05670 [Acidobacteriota bacterium]